jgi:hypothetical protein
VRAHPLGALPGAALLARAVTLAGARSSRLAAASLEAGIEEAAGNLMTGLAGLTVRATNEATVVCADAGSITQ